MKFTLLAMLVLSLMTLLMPTKALAFPPDGLRVIYYSDGTHATEVGRQYVCWHHIYMIGSTSSYYTSNIAPENCWEL